MLVAVVLAALAAVAGAGWYFFGRVAEPSVAMRVCGSNLIGSALGFDVVQGFFSRAGGTQIEVTPFDTGGEATVTATIAGSTTRVALRADGSGAAYVAIAAGTCQAALVDRPPTPDELAKIHGRYVGASAEYTRSVATDAVVVIVNTANPTTHLTMAQLRGIVAGTTTRWSDVGRGSGPIVVYAPPPGSDVANIVASEILDGSALPPHVKRIASSLALAGAVARDRNGLGIVALSDAASAKPVALGAGKRFIAPNVGTIGTTYPLSIKLGLYAPARGDNPTSAKFAQYLATDDAKNVIGNAGLVPAGP